jgi:hypothetical protein
MKGFNLQIEANCEAVQLLNSTQSDIGHPEWVTKARTPVLVGGYLGIIVGYVLSLYTIFHVARAYKKLEMKVCLHASNLS